MLHIIGHNASKSDLYLIYNYNMCVRACVRASDGIVPRFNGPAEPARTVGFRKRESARTVGFRKRENDAASFVKTKRQKSRGEFPLLLNKFDQETEISRRVSAATEQIQP
jgi:hypothetical protein